MYILMISDGIFVGFYCFVVVVVGFFFTGVGREEGEEGWEVLFV